MKKTNKVLSVLLAVVMMFSAMSVSLFASAAEEPKPVYNATYVLDMLDGLLAEKDLNSNISLPSEISAVITVDLNSVNGICKTLTSLANIWEATGFAGLAVGLMKGLVGDLKNLNLTVWKMKTPYTRGTDAKDTAIIDAVVRFLKDNTALIQKFLEGKIDLGIVNNIEISGKSLKETINGALGDEGVCGKLKGLLAGLVYEENSADYKACVAKALDKIIFEDLATVGLDKLLKMADDAIIANWVESENPVEPIVYLYKDLEFKLVGSFSDFTYDSGKTLDGFIADAANALYKKAQKPLSQMIKKYGAELNALLASSGEYGAPFAGLFDFTKLSFNDFTSKSITDINVFVGMLVKQISAFKWNDKANLGENLQELFMWAIKNRDTKAAETDVYATVKGSDFAAYALSLAKMIVTNVVTGDDKDTVVAKMNQCKNATEVLTILLPYLLNRGDATIVSAKSKTYEQVLGDIVGYYTKDILPYKWTASQDIWTVLNNIVNYYLVTWNVDALFGLELNADQTIFQKLDAIQNVLMGDIDSTKLSVYIPTLLKNILALDLKALVKDGFEDAFSNKNQNVPAAELICKIVNNLYKSVLKADIFSFAYKPATTAADGSLTVKCNLDKKDVATVKIAKVNTKVALSKTSYTFTGKALKPTATVTDSNGAKLEKDKDYTVAYKNNTNAGTATVTVTLKGKYDGSAKATFKINPADASKATVKLAKTSYPYTGKAITTKATVKVGSTTLTENKDYKLTYKNNKAVGTATVTITFIGNYKATAKKATFKIVPAAVKSLKASAFKTTSLKLTWAKSAGATYYKVEQSTNGSKWTVVSAATKSNSITVSKLKAGTKYQFRVTPLGSDKKIAGTAATVKTGTLTAAPSVTVKSTKSKTATVTWKKVAGASKYVVYKSTDGKKWDKGTSTTKTTLTLSKLTGGKKIYVKVAAVNAYKAEAASAVKSATVKK